MSDEDKYCCEPFEAHVKERFFQLMWEEKDGFGNLYHSGWGVLVLETTRTIDPVDKDTFAWEFPVSDFNFMPLKYCPFCGGKL